MREPQQAAVLLKQLSPAREGEGEQPFQGLMVSAAVQRFFSEKAVVASRRQAVPAVGAKGTAAIKTLLCGWGFCFVNIGLYTFQAVVGLHATTWRVKRMYAMYQIPESVLVAFHHRTTCQMAHCAAAYEGCGMLLLCLTQQRWLRNVRHADWCWSLLLLLLATLQVTARHVSRELLRMVLLHWATACITPQHPVPHSQPFDEQLIPGHLSAGLEVTTAACCCINSSGSHCRLQLSASVRTGACLARAYALYGALCGLCGCRDAYAHSPQFIT
jgi:hypothetical protein